ncbi:MAG: GNAT family N-acetyltransferase [Candidatus Micrarchaeaceae archaeon]
MMISSKGSKVYLSPICTDDADAIVENINDMAVIGALGNPSISYPYTRDNALGFIAFASQKYATAEEFHMGIRVSGTGLVGVCGLFNMSMHDRHSEIGYWLGKRHWGNGYASGALRLLIGFGFRTLDLERIHAQTLKDNERSIRLLKSIGFRHVGDGIASMSGLYVFALQRDSYGNAMEIHVER